MKKKTPNPFMLNTIAQLRQQANTKRHLANLRAYRANRDEARENLEYWELAIAEERKQHQQILAALKAKLKKGGQK
jgi:hypothetical protein